ncbi:MAG: hypothetical protein IIW15_03965 [Firmicutes bacterium]|nr:hypothetical protein [Bacillota bacterium]
MNTKNRFSNRLIMGLVFLFLYAPIFLLICMALTDMFSNPEEKEGLLL